MSFSLRLSDAEEKVGVVWSEFHVISAADTHGKKKTVLSLVLFAAIHHELDFIV